MEDVLESPFARKTEAHLRSRGAAKARQAAAARLDRSLNDRRASRRKPDRPSRRTAAADQGRKQSDRKDCGRHLPLRLALLVVLYANGCASTSEKPGDFHSPHLSADQRRPEIESRQLSLAKGFVQLTLTIPPPKPGHDKQPVIINPIVDQNELLERSIVVARYRLNWAALPKPQQPKKPRVAETSTRKKSVGTWLLASPSAAVIGKGYFGLIWTEGTSAKQVVEHLRTLPFVDPERIGIAGISTNGFKALSAILAGVPLRAAVVVGACPDYHSFLANSPLALGGDTLNLEPEYETWLSEHEPLRQAGRLTQTALLLVNGGKDHVIPVQCIENSAPAIGDAYAGVGRPDHFRLSWWPDATHNELTEIATPTILRWWGQWLGSPTTR